MPMLTERARAKINLTLKVLGRRPDGYHELESLVAFAEAGDQLSLDTDRAPGLEVVGPFAPSIAGENLIAVTLARASAAAPDLRLGHICLDKQLPVAAGIGGGSADAAAVLRLLIAANPAHAKTVDWYGLAQSIGADVPVCFANTASWMGGTGERLVALDRPLPPLFAVLANSRVAVPPDKTARVFKALGAAALAEDVLGRDTARPRIPDIAELLALLRRCGNDLEAPATAVVPELDLVLEGLESQPGAVHTQASGAGPTAFAIFLTREMADGAAVNLADAHPSWWIASTVLS